MWQETFAELLERDRPLAELTTVRVGGPARHLVLPRDERDVASLLRAFAREGIPYRVLGGGSNLLPPDEPILEPVLHPARLDRFAVEGRRIRAGAGLPLSVLVARANDAGLAGLQGLAGIPGQIGGAIVMNAGGRFGEIGHAVERVHLRLAGGEAAAPSRDELGFGYRSSRLPEGAVVVGADFLLEPVADPRELKRVSGSILKEKNRAQPTTGWNFGCMFANPEGRSAGRLVHEAGLAGATQGAARISPLHGNFVENLGGATAADVRALIEQAERAVLDRFGLALRREVVVWRA